MTAIRYRILPDSISRFRRPHFHTLHWFLLCVTVVLGLRILLSMRQMNALDTLDHTASPSVASDGSPSPFRRPKGTEHLRCDLFFADNQTYWRRYRYKRLTFEDPRQLPMHCDDIRRRQYFPTKPMSAEEANFPIAQMRVVYRDYILLEMELAAAYAPQNLYCYVVDSKSSILFKHRIRQLATCFPNVVIATEKIHPRHNGFGMDRARLACMQKLLRRPEPWKYVLVVQNHEVTLKTNRETVQILKWLNGSNDIELATNRRLGRIKNFVNLNWTMDALNIWKTDEEPVQYELEDVNPSDAKSEEEDFSKESVGPLPPNQFFVSKGYAAMALRREFCDFVLRRLDLRVLMERLDRPERYGVDEFLFPSLHSNAELAAPGSFASVCTERNVVVPLITRFAIWNNHCRSRQMRHWICIPGAEDLPTIIASLPHIFFNKFLPSFDFGASVCWYEHLYNRTYLGAESPSLPRDLYTQLSHARFQSLKDPNGHVDSEELAQFDCRPPSWPHLIQQPGG